MTRYLYALLPLLLLPLSSVAETLPPQQYRCDNGSQIELSFSTADDGRPQAEVYFADTRITLPQVFSTTDLLYRADDIRLQKQDEGVLFTDGKGNSRHCQPMTSATTSSNTFLDLSGNIVYHPRHPLPPGALLVIRVRDLAHARTLAEQRIELRDQSQSIPFATTIDRDLIGKKARIRIAAHIEHRGKRLFTSQQASPVLHQGQAHPLTIQLIQVNHAQAR